MEFDVAAIDDDGIGAGRYGQNVVHEMQQQFIVSHWFIHHKLKNGRLYCDHCGIEFPATLSFWIVVDALSEQLMCHPCNNKKRGIDPYEEIKKNRDIAEESRKVKMEETRRIQKELNDAANQKKEKKEKKIKEQQQQNNQLGLF